MKRIKLLILSLLFVFNNSKSLDLSKDLFDLSKDLIDQKSVCVKNFSQINKLSQLMDLIKNSTIDQKLAILGIIRFLYDLPSFISFIKDNLKLYMHGYQHCLCRERHSPLSGILYAVLGYIPTIFLLINSYKLFTSKVKNSNKLFGICGISVSMVANLINLVGYLDSSNISDTTRSNCFVYLLSNVLTAYNSYRLIKLA